MKTINYLLLLPIFWSCSNGKELTTVKNVSLEKYQGTWYEIARIPNQFEKGLKCVTATYKLKDNGDIEVVNSGVVKDDPEKTKTSKGKAWIPNSDEPGKIKVSFFWPFAGDYQILLLDKNYSYVLVGSPSLDYLWMLSRTKKLDSEIIELLKKEAEDQGFDTNRLEYIDQDCM